MEIKKKTIAQIDLVLNDGNSDLENRFKEVIKSVDDNLIGQNSPKDFRSDNPENILNQIDRSFENLCASLQEAGISNPKKLTVFEFYQRVIYFESRKKPNTSDFV